MKHKSGEMQMGCSLAVVRRGGVLRCDWGVGRDAQVSQFKWIQQKIPNHCIQHSVKVWVPQDPTGTETKRTVPLENQTRSMGKGFQKDLGGGAAGRLGWKRCGHPPPHRVWEGANKPKFSWVGTF